MRKAELWMLAGLVALMGVTRWPLAPKYLFYFDSVNMALALDDFDPRLHQPQPPGYPLYVGLCRVIHDLGFTVEDTFLVSGILAGTVAGWLLWRLGAETGRPRAGLLAALLFTFTPVFWFNSLTNQSRGFSAVASAGTAWLCWRAAKRDSHPGWLAAAAFFVGTLAGFRPVETLMLTPLLLWTIWMRRPPWTAIASATVAGALPALAWGWVLLTESGGLESYITMMRDYSKAERIFESGSAPNPLRVLMKSLEYVGAMHLVTLLPWVWALLWTRPPLEKRNPPRGEGLFMLVWLLPGLAFQVVGHAADPGHSLATIAGVCWLGGVTLNRLPGRVAWAGALLSCILATALFLSPLRGAARATSYHVVRRVTQGVNEAINTIRVAERDGPVTIVVRDTLVTYRHMRYYFPQSDLWVEGEKQRWSPSGATEFPSAESPRVAVLDKAGIHFGLNAEARR